jgi:hypothetical protein
LIWIHFGSLYLSRLEVFSHVLIFSFGFLIVQVYRFYFGRSGFFGYLILF